MKLDPSTVDRMSWLYYDPFLRFLHTIGLENAALLKTVQFTGVARTTANHLLRGHTASLASDDIRLNLQTYVKFINQFCQLKTVKTLILRTVDSSEPEKYVPIIFSLATDTMQLFTDRTAGRAAEDRRLAGFMF
ncbi:hypothetical protein BPAE_0195g00180 [Botrytis paeoniae]|uniref:Uncharacterized protein n=1 Tax=Botrytis paeoniae TaxID=278948 RepID=A0A4Z1FBU8_9HELO|nr:hypothetical protein BPAE_0195g00180 [Botrytis paeoniae]